MGMAYGFVCNDCGKSHVVFTGGGMAFPSEYEKTVNDVKAGRYGKEWQEIAAQTEHFAIDAESHLFRCEHCGFWECSPSLSIYAPKNVKKAARERERAPYVLAEDLKSDYTLVKERVHTCERCGHDMRMFSERGAQRAALKCPDCGAKLERSPELILWD